MPATYSKRRYFFRCGSLLLVSVVLVSAPTNPSSAADNDGNAVETQPAETNLIAPAGLEISDEAEVAAVVEIWKKVRGKDAPTVDPGELAKALQKLKAQEAEAKNPPSRYDLGNRYDYPNTFENKLADQKFADAPTIARADKEPVKNDKLTSLRETARKLDAMAEELDELELYEQADGLRQQAQTIRKQWRQIRTSENTSRFTIPVLPEPAADGTKASSRY